MSLSYVLMQHHIPFLADALCVGLFEAALLSCSCEQDVVVMPSVEPRISCKAARCCSFSLEAFDALRYIRFDVRGATVALQEACTKSFIIRH